MPHGLASLRRTIRTVGETDIRPSIKKSGGLRSISPHVTPHKCMNGLQSFMKTRMAVPLILLSLASGAAGYLLRAQKTDGSLATGEMKLAQNGRFEMGSSSIRFLTPIH